MDGEFIIIKKIIRVLIRAAVPGLVFMAAVLSCGPGLAVSGGSPLPAGSGAFNDLDYYAPGDGGTVSLDLRGADLRDVLSALAIKLGVNIVVVNTKPVEVNLKADGVTARQALEMVVQSNGLAYLQSGDLIVVGEAGSLRKDFFSQMILTRFDTWYVPAAKIIAMIKELGLDDSLKVLSIDTNPNVFWAQGTVQSLRKVRELVSAVDTAENRESAVSSQVPLEYKTLTLTQIPPSRAVELLKEAGVEITHCLKLDNRLLVFDRTLFPMWDQVESLVAQLDIQPANKYKVFVYQLKNIVAADAAARLKEFGFEDVKTVTYSNDRFGRELLVICPPYLETSVRSALSSLDGVRSKTKMPVLTMTGTSSYEGLVAVRELLSELSDVPIGSFSISRNLSGDEDNPVYALWVEETPDRIMLIKDLIGELDIGGGKGGSKESSGTE
ncbi:MAG: energy transducer TonB [Pelotomaculum sp.]|nr:energy transducer TonB [Pelotomaculum sp.]